MSDDWRPEDQPGTGPDDDWYPEGDPDLGPDEDWYPENEPARPRPGDGWSSDVEVPVREGDARPGRPPASGRRRLLVVLGALFAVLVLVAAAVALWVRRQIDPPGPPGDPIAIVVPVGATSEDIGRLLDAERVITRSSIWNYYVRFKDEGPFQAGDYVFRENSSFSEAIAVLEAGPRPPEAVRATVPEGLTVVEIIARLSDPELGVAWLSADVMHDLLASGEVRSRFQPAEVASMEGLLFPETYEFDDEDDERAVLDRLVAQLDATLVELDIEARAADLGMTPYEIVIIASLVEEEARVPGDRDKIARVIYNRLDQGIPLGIDATSRYEAELAGRDRDDIDFSSDSPYNTRRVAGLPPTPIAAPGRAAFEAALAPADGDWIFYVLMNAEGEHFFTASNEEFLAAKRECKRQGLGCG